MPRTCLFCGELHPERSCYYEFFRACVGYRLSTVEDLTLRRLARLQVLELLDAGHAEVAAFAIGKLLVHRTEWEWGSLNETDRRKLEDAWARCQP